MSKSDHMLAILWMLSSGNKVTAKQIAEKLEINIRTVYRYIDALSVSGVPIISDAGHHGGYSLAASFHKAPLFFNLEEKKALLHAATHAADSGYPFSEVLGGAIEKLRWHSTGDHEDLIARHIEGLEVAGQNLLPEQKQLLEALSAAVTSQTLIEITYRNKRDETLTQRTLEPYGLLSWHGKWYLVGHCHKRDQIRSFRVDRIQQMTPTTTPFTRPKDFSAKAYFLKSMMPDVSDASPLISLVISGRAEALDDLCHHWFLAQALQERTLNQAIFLLDSFALHNHVVGYLLTYGKSIRIIEPQSCNRRLFEMTQELGQYYLGPK